MLGQNTWLWMRHFLYLCWNMRPMTHSNIPTSVSWLSCAEFLWFVWRQFARLSFIMAVALFTCWNYLHLGPTSIQLWLYISTLRKLWMTARVNGTLEITKQLGCQKSPALPLSCGPENVSRNLLQTLGLQAVATRTCVRSFWWSLPIFKAMKLHSECRSKWHKGIFGKLKPHDEIGEN